MKGQTATEYIMTYGLAVLIIIIVASVIAYYGIFSPKGFVIPESRNDVCENLDEYFGIDMECDYERYGNCECYYSQDCIEIEDYKICEKHKNPDVIFYIERSD